MEAGSQEPEARMALAVWLDSAGKTQALPAPPGPYGDPRISPERPEDGGSSRVVEWRVEGQARREDTIRVRTCIPCRAR